LNVDLVISAFVPMMDLHRYKSFFNYFLCLLQIEQNGQHNSLQIQQIKDIARLCPEEAGMTVYIAQGLLSDCDLAEIEEEIAACTPELEVEPRSKYPQQSNDLGGIPEKGFFFYPNPSKGKVLFSNQKGVQGKAAIFSAAGHLLKSYTVKEGEHFWNIDLPSGIYLIRITFDNGELITDQLILNK